MSSNSADRMKERMASQRRAAEGLIDQIARTRILIAETRQLLAEAEAASPNPMPHEREKP